MSPDSSDSAKPERTSIGGNFSSPGPVMEARTITYDYSESLPSVIDQLEGSVLLSSHTTGNIIVLSAANQKLAVSFHPFEQPMGMAVRPGWLLVGTRTQVWSSAMPRKLPAGSSGLDTTTLAICRVSRISRAISNAMN